MELTLSQEAFVVPESVKKLLKEWVIPWEVINGGGGVEYGSVSYLQVYLKALKVETSHMFEDKLIQAFSEEGYKVIYNDTIL